MKPIIEEMGRLCVMGESFALATVISRNGSAPRSAGAKMLVKADGRTTGTVGGGMLEAQVQRLAAQMIRERRAMIQSFQFSGKDAADMDAICGGQVEVLVECVDASEPGIASVIHGLQDAIAHHRKAWLVTILPEDAQSTSHALIRQDGSVLGILPPGIDPAAVIEARLPERIVAGQSQAIVEPVNISGSAFIFGAGHVSRSLAAFVKAVGFYTVILDDRAEYANLERFPDADELVVLDSFADISKIAIDADSYVVIVTRGHQNDLVVLVQVLRCQTAYTGMIGSRRKTALIFEELRRRGFTESDIQRVHAPIGIPIDAETPEEIGISIVAEMIQARARSQKGI